VFVLVAGSIFGFDLFFVVLVVVLFNVSLYSK